MSEPIYLLDADICIYVLEGGPAPIRVQVERRAPGEVVTSAIAYAEVMRGLIDDRVKTAAAAAFFAIIVPMPFEAHDALHYAGLPFRRAGFDRLIAAHAVARNLILVTNNEKDFTGVPGLRVENWTQ